MGSRELRPYRKHVPGGNGSVSERSKTSMVCEVKIRAKPGIFGGRNHWLLDFLTKHGLQLFPEPCWATAQVLLNVVCFICDALVAAASWGPPVSTRLGGRSYILPPLASNAVHTEQCNTGESSGIRNHCSQPVGCNAFWGQMILSQESPRIIENTDICIMIENSRKLQL